MRAVASAPRDNSGLFPHLRGSDPASHTMSMPGYQTKQERVCFADADDLLVRSLLDRQQFFDPLGTAERLGISSATWPLFGLLWPSGGYLAARMALRPVRPRERILEIGCGLALPSLIGHRRGADVTASDCHPLAREFLEANLRLNNLAPLPYRHGQWRSPALRQDQRAAGACSQGRYDLIIGSDVLYERDEGGALAGFIDQNAQPVAEVWIIDPDRGNRPAFHRQMARQGFGVVEERLRQPATPGVAAYKGRVLIYTRTSG